jgi:hypothetical protein
MPITGMPGYDVNPVMHDGHVDQPAQKAGIALDDAMEAARLLSGSLEGGSLKYAKVRVCDTGTSRIVAEFIHGDRLVADYRAPHAEAQAGRGMKDAGFPVIPPGEIAAEVTADVHRLGLDRKPGKAQR